MSYIYRKGGGIFSIVTEGAEEEEKNNTSCKRCVNKLYRKERFGVCSSSPLAGPVVLV